jgi:hypothetical protein
MIAADMPTCPPGPAQVVANWPVASRHGHGGTCGDTIAADERHSPGCDLAGDGHGEAGPQIWLTRIPAHVAPTRFNGPLFLVALVCLSASVAELA